MRGGARSSRQEARHRRRRRCRHCCGAKLGDTGAAHALVMLVARAGDAPSPARRSWSSASARAPTCCCSRSRRRSPSCPSATACRAGCARRKEETNYTKFLSFNELLPIERGMRAEIDKKTALSVAVAQARHGLRASSAASATCAARCSSRAARSASIRTATRSTPRSPIRSPGTTAQGEVVHGGLADLFARSAVLLRHDRVRGGRALDDRLHRHATRTSRRRRRCA